MCHLHLVRTLGAVLVLLVARIVERVETSAEDIAACALAPTSQEVDPPNIPGRFNMNWYDFVPYGGSFVAIVDAVQTCAGTPDK